MQNSPMGGWIMIHGCGSFPNNWTAGCIALDDADIDLLFPLVPHRTPILILP
jgi:L,D-peptidoglycan transpeptidase YkuD (ErfK/YbiS/YcfS/YnhG family)